ncbi:MAG: ABC transporter substrate-binding protein [Spirochaetales bacterium]
MKRYFTVPAAILFLFALLGCEDNQELSRSIPDPGKTITHAAGETVVPENPERVVALDNIALDSVIALDVEPVGALINENTGEFPVHLRERITDTTRRLASSEQDLERITQLEPDLIIGGKNVESAYEQLNQIAPTILLGESGTTAWKDKLLLTAEALGDPDRGQELLDEYNENTSDLASRIEEPSDIEVSIVRVFPDGLRLYQNETFVGGILNDVGLSRPSSQDKDQLWDNISLERAEEADGDAVFVWSLGEEADRAYEQLQEDPLWASLDAVQAGNVYSVPGYWIGRGPIAADEVLNDLERYLVDERDD